MDSGWPPAGPKSDSSLNALLMRATSQSVCRRQGRTVYYSTPLHIGESLAAMKKIQSQSTSKPELDLAARRGGRAQW